MRIEKPGYTGPSPEKAAAAAATTRCEDVADNDDHSARDVADTEDVAAGADAADRSALPLSA
ncbi:hypothetical protein NJB1907f44_11410 [Mycobacterium marinum]|nr:hypothetical protein NJB1907f34b_16860 [Mycobacterium marinum]GJO05464.1 hypothetical protein NJB1808e29_33160 [Mycobacterium marinum]GJO12769.1 hypothetical protein NJB1907E90_35370 [Mycobacterium marinum]GJO21567.1 hypothetical protein NJB1907E11_30650 [Mycobacterium marinum]GJO30654.1 hypothetical protein NJB1728e18_46330 [Mycobacterium marinum]